MLGCLRHMPLDLAAKLKKAGRTARAANAVSTVANDEFIAFLGDGTGKRAVTTASSAMRLQANVRRLVVRTRKSRLVQQREVARRHRAREARQKDGDSSLTFKSQYLSDIYMHNEDALNFAVNNVATVNRNHMMRSFALNMQKLLHSFHCLSRVNAAATEGGACDEMALMLCELFHGSQCDIYPVESHDNELHLRVNHRIFLRARDHGVCCRIDDNSAPVTTHPNFGSSAEDAGLSVLEWYHAPCPRACACSCRKPHAARADDSGLSVFEC